MILNYYVHTKNVNYGDKYYDYTFAIGDNITVDKDEIIKFKLINFSLMNAMLNISSYHGNNSFKFSYLGVMTIVNIPDGSYTATSLRDKINALGTIANYPFALNYDKITNKYWIAVADGVLTNQFVFYPSDCSELLGFTKTSYSWVTGDYYADTFANMLSYSKICLTSSSLAFNNTTENNLEVKYKNNMGISEMICWVSRDVPPFTTIDYTNLEGVEFDVASPNIKTINFKIQNEYKQLLVDAPPAFIQFQLIIDKKVDWPSKFFKLLNDMYYAILSLYFK